MSCISSTFHIPCGTEDGAGSDDAEGDAELAWHAPMMGAGWERKVPAAPYCQLSTSGVLSLWPLAIGFIMGF